MNTMISFDYKDAIRNSYWVHTEFNFSGDVQDFKVNTTPAEKTVIKRTMLAIAQIEVQVKTFWSDIYEEMPKAEIGSVGMTFAESESATHGRLQSSTRCVGDYRRFRRSY